MTQHRGWIGIDLDGTLAHFDRNRGLNHIGKPVPAMVERVRHMLTKGERVKIFTARASLNDEGINTMIKKWCAEHVGVELEVTCIKDFEMIALYDDRAFQVIPNTGKIVRAVNKMKEK